MKRTTRLIAMILVIIQIVLTACKLVGLGVSQEEAAQVALQTLSAQMTLDALARPTLAPSETALPTLTETPTPEPSPTPSPTVAHLMTPGDPPDRVTWVSDLSSRSLASEKRAVGDNFNRNLLERPFTSQVMDYQNYLDIIETDLSYAAPWMYATITLEGDLPAGIPAAYGLEVDVDMDGRGDWYIVALAPPGAQWTTDQVRAWKDGNEDVGGANPMVAELPNPVWSGYEQLVFDQGGGDDPDMAWVRRDPNRPNRIQMAFKYSLIGSAEKFLFGAWADEGVQQPGWMDYNDHFTIDQAGSPVINAGEYPLKELASVDNTCRWSYGFKPVKQYPGLCQLLATPTPTRAPVCTEPPMGCPVFGSVKLEWNQKKCECVAPACQPPPNGCPVFGSVRLVWDQKKCECVVP
ncbi:MAG: hypothetical protein PHD58_05180 [Anaerolineales bacterium]|nr:hypothetical protein [Anaerolineales bacterium]